jgi:SAM-dependent methyltransferase
MEHRAASRGQPSFVWQFGQERRLALISAHVPAGARLALDVGCGVGMYTMHLAELCGTAIGIEVEWLRARQARANGLAVMAAVSEQLPIAAATCDVILLHEVLEHVADDRATVREVVRALAPGGRAIFFVPNRWWPFETHGVFWRGRYHFGNIPAVSYLPDPLRNRLAPHVRVYTAGSLRALFDGLPVTVVEHTQVFPGYDKLATRRPRLGGALRAITYALEQTPLRRFGLSHLLVISPRAS